MLLVDHVREAFEYQVPGALHEDKSVRVQTVTSQDDPLFHRVIEAFDEVTGVPMIINTSLNLKGDPLACSPEDALNVLERADVDVLLLGPFLVTKVSW